MFDDGYAAFCQTVVEQGAAPGIKSIGRDAYCGCVDFLSRYGAADHPLTETDFADDRTAGEA